MISDAKQQINRALWVYALLVLFFTGMSWIAYKRHQIFYARPLFMKSDQFRDLTNYTDKVAHLLGQSRALGQGVPIFTYPAPAAFVYKVLLYTIPSHPVRTYLAFLAICVIGFAITLWRASQANAASKISTGAAIIITALLGYPLWIAADRGNIEGVVWAISGVGLCFLLRAKYWIAAILIGVASAIKPFPVLFLLLLLRRKKYKEAALGLAIMALITVTALTALGSNPLKAYKDLRPGIALYTERYITNLPPMEEARFDHSLLDRMKAAALVVKTGSMRPKKVVAEELKLSAEPKGWPVVRVLLRIYPVFAIAGFCILLAVFYKMPVLNQLTALAVAITIFPLSAADYSLLHLYLPFGALLVFLTREVAAGKVAFPYPAALSFAVIYSLLFAPLTFLTIYAADAKLLLLIALLFVAARSPMNSEYFKDERHA